MTAAIHEKIVIIDYGSQYTQLIARRVREHQVFCSVVTPAVALAELAAPGVRAVILSGGPSSVYGPNAPRLPEGLMDLDLPILGICYGMQLLGQHFGGDVRPAKEREFGRRVLEVVETEGLLSGTPAIQTVWMSHGDQVERLSDTFAVLGRTETCPWAAIRHKERPIFAIQFHPEVHHSDHGKKILANFLFDIAGCRGDWAMSAFIDEQVQKIRAQVGKRKVICGLSGGVDSSVAAVIVHKAIGDQLSCIFVDNGLMRKNEGDEVEATFREHFQMDFHRVDASERFLGELAGVSDPEKKRKIIGRVFIEVFEDKAKEFDDVGFLVQGTLYPDVIESVSPHGGPSHTIKSHHNVGGLPERLGFGLVEPLRDLFKDEVRAVGREMGIPEHVLGRHPFPGPGLGVRLLGDIKKEDVLILQEADAILQQEMRRAKIYDDIWQAFCVLLPVRSVGVMGDERTYEKVCAVRCVNSTDGMTADWYPMPYEIMGRISNRIINEVRGINRVCYDISSKPPATIEWE